MGGLPGIFTRVSSDDVDEDNCDDDDSDDVGGLFLVVSTFFVNSPGFSLYRLFSWLFLILLKICRFLIILTGFIWPWNGRLRAGELKTLPFFYNILLLFLFQVYYFVFPFDFYYFPLFSVLLF